MAILEKKLLNPLKAEAQAYLVELFSAIQGEGPIVGCRQVFLRFLGCHIACAYCDTPDTHTRQRQCRVEITAGQRDFEMLDNPVPIPVLLERIQRLEHFSGLHDGISLTGGEPLQHIRVLKKLLPELPLPIYLETDGILYHNLLEIIEHLSLIGMDIKIPSATGLRPYWEEHRQFLQIAARQEVFVKVVLTARTTDEELQEAIAIVKACDRAIPMILQPVTPYGRVNNPPSSSQLLEWQAMAKKELCHVRVIPQTHKMMGEM